MAAYLALGLELVPAASASGVPHGVHAPSCVRAGTAGDADTIAEVGRAVRGASHGGDVDALVASGHQLLVHPGRGFATHRPGLVSIVAARDEEAASDLLRAALAASGGDGIEVEWLTAQQQWAVDVCRQARLSFHLGWGAVLTGGEVGPLCPYLPSGAYL